MKMNKIYKLASIISRLVEKSTTNKKHVAAVIKNGKIVNIRSNTPGIHAEYLAVVDALKFHKNCKTVLVIRYEKGIFKNSLPCKECIEKLKLNVKKIIYSTGNNNCPFIIKRVDEISNDWQSNLIRKCRDRIYVK
jgi:hypothetical protein